MKPAGHLVGSAAAVILVLLGPVAGLAAFRVARGKECDRAELRFAEDLAQRSFALEKELSVGVEVLRAAQSFFAFHDSVSREEFGAFATRALARHPSIQALEWIPRVPGAQRQAHEDRARLEGLEGYRIRDALRHGEMAPSPGRKEYYPVFFVEPRAGNEAALGFDLGSDRSRNAALLRAMDSGEPTLSDPVVLVQDAGSSYGFLALLPVFSQPMATSPDRHSGLKGFVLGVFRIEELIRQSLRESADDPGARMHLELVDEDVDGEPLVFFSSEDRPEERSAAAWIRRETIALGGQRWHLVGEPTQQYLSRFSTRQPLAAGTGVFLGWELLAGLVLLLAKRSQDRGSRRQTLVAQSVLESLSEGVVVADNDGKPLVANEVARRILGTDWTAVPLADWPRAFGCYLPDTKTLHPADQLPLARAIRGEEVSEMKLFLQNPEVPEGVWLSVNATPLKDEEGVVLGGVAVFRDITSLTKQQEELRRRVRELAEIKHALDQAAIVVITDERGVIRHANDRLCEITRCSRQELLSGDRRILDWADQPDGSLRDMWRTIARGRVWRGEIRNRAEDGAYRWVDATVVPALDDRGKPMQYFTICTEITDRKRSEEVVLRLSNAVEQTDDTVFITDRTGAIEYVNPAFERTTGYSREEVLGQTPRILKSGEQDPDYYRELWTTILEGRVFRGTPINRKKNGELYWAEQTVTPMRDSSGQVTHFVSVVKDMTERRRIQEQEIEMQLAARVQQKLFPEHPPQIEGYDFGGAVFPATETCGDYFDFFSTPNGRLSIVIGDVCGHGVGPALVMAQTRAYLRSLAQVESDPGAIFTRLNEILVADLDDRLYVTLLLACLDVPTGSLVYANAGHPAGYVLDASGALKATLEASGVPIGLVSPAMFPHLGYSSRNIVLEPGELAVFVTDGLTERHTPDDRQFGSEGVLEVVKAHRHTPAREIVERLHQAAGAFAQGQPQGDDVTVVICKRDPAPR